MFTVILLTLVKAKLRYAERYITNCGYADCRYAKYQNTDSHYAELCNAVCYYGEFYHAECRYAE
jgi:hypothetical protein